MDLTLAQKIKHAIASSFMGKARHESTIFTFNAAIAPPSASKELRTAINGVGIAEEPDGDIRIKVLTRVTGIRTSAIVKRYGIPSEQLLVERAGPITFKMPTNNHRPPFPGISVGHYQVTAGTLGCFVQDEKSRIYVLSNNHVLCNTNKGFYNDPILQPGRLDGGSRKKDIIAYLSYYIPIETSKPNIMDAAIAQVDDDLPLHYAINKKKIVSGSSGPTIGLRVEKYGRSTGYTNGIITTRNLDLQVDFDGQLIDFQDQFEIKGLIKGGKKEVFCKDGDSGALILSKGKTEAVGLLFAGTYDGTTFASPIKNILDSFSIKIL